MSAKRSKSRKTKAEIDETRSGNYRRGARLERLARASLERQGYSVVRSAGSKGKIDLVAWNSEHLRLIQCKAEGASDRKTRETLAALQRPTGATVELWERSASARSGWEIETFGVEQVVERCSHGAIDGQCKIATCLYSPVVNEIKIERAIVKMGANSFAQDLQHYPTRVDYVAEIANLSDEEQRAILIALLKTNGRENKS